MFNIRPLDLGSSSIAIVTAIGYESPLSSLFDIEHELTCLLGKELNGEVIFDLVCSNGLEWNRFMSLQVKNGSFDYNSISILDKTDLLPQLIDEQAFFLSNNLHYLQDSVLTFDEIPCVIGV
ncbi:type II toxin-antitoxin system RnlB family antitoxin [Shewanella oncorhynchi]|uniref:type II toxin-antitoxin system RnlB family antitoxin n=1 Tax=Shewanella oncorhynchi TaxID=2726434 RepID=UPI003D7A2866